MVADLNVHWGRTASGEGQQRSHVVLTMREVGPDRFGKKVRDWNRTEVRVGREGSGQERFTTREILVTDQRVKQAATALAERRAREVDLRKRLQEPAALDAGRRSHTAA